LCVTRDVIVVVIVVPLPRVTGCCYGVGLACWGCLLATIPCAQAQFRAWGFYLQGYAYTAFWLQLQSPRQPGTDVPVHVKWISAADQY
jgi:hypothetical protein